jgi:phosphoglycerate dehydrogenase-like enzyme
LLSRGAPGKLLINTAGAWIVEPVALRAALECGNVRAAAFDGYWIEPLPEIADDPYGLLGLPDHQFVVTPHTAARTPQTWIRMCDQAIQQVIDAIAR